MQRVSPRIPGARDPTRLTRYPHGQLGTVICSCWHVLNLPQDEHVVAAVQYLAKDDVLAVEEVGGRSRDEELRTVSHQLALLPGTDGVAVPSAPESRWYAVRCLPLKALQREDDSQRHVPF